MHDIIITSSIMYQWEVMVDGTCTALLFDFCLHFLHSMKLGPPCTLGQYTITSFHFVHDIIIDYIIPYVHYIIAYVYCTGMSMGV